MPEPKPQPRESDDSGSGSRDVGGAGGGPPVCPDCDLVVITGGPLSVVCVVVACDVVDRVTPSLVIDTESTRTSSSIELLGGSGGLGGSDAGRMVFVVSLVGGESVTN